MIYLYKKTHNKTGLQYLGKTLSKDPYKYPGSGVYWTNHLNKHGDDVSTEILRECKTEKELVKWGQHYSKLYNVVESKDWANLTEEAGPGGAWTQESKEKLSATNKKRFAKMTAEERTEHMRRSCCKPESYTAERSEKISKANLGKKMPRTEAWINAEADRIERFKQAGIANGAKHKGRTWKLVNGKRKWMDRV